MTAPPASRSTGWPDGRSVMERRDPDAYRDHSHDYIYNAINAIATASFDAGWCGLCFLGLFRAGSPSRGRKLSHSHACLYISLVMLHIKYTERREDDFNVHA